MELVVQLSDEQVELIARRAAELVLERQERDVAPASTDDRQWLTVSAAAEFLGCGAQRIYTLRSTGKLSSFKEGGRAMVARAELDALVNAGRALSPAEEARRVA